MTKRLRVLRWAGFMVLLLLAMRGAIAMLHDFPAWRATDELRYVTPGSGWTAFERCIDYRFIPDRDTELYLARSIEDKSTWIRIAPTDTHLLGPMEWRSSKHLWIPASFRDGSLRHLDDVLIEWDDR